MQGDKRVLELLNEQLTAELTVINQYFLHAKMQQHWGYTKLATITRSESIDEMKHADALTDRILLLDGLPNYQRIGTLDIGQTVREQLRADREAEVAAVQRLRAAVTEIRGLGDVTSAVLLEGILADEEEHLDYLDTQLALVDSLGEALYLAQQIDADAEG